MFTKLYLPFLIISVVLINLLVLFSPNQVHAQTQTTFWKYQCIDTMKESRDNARAATSEAELEANVAWEMKTIKSLGANCVAIDTPYDAEFLPTLHTWIAGARKENLHIWFRGNFSGWEGWFGYPKITSADEEIAQLDSFIKNNPTLFQDGDIFTGIPEAENGGPFGQVNPDQYPAYRQLLIDEYNMEQKAFGDIHKNVTVNWFSMNGDIAQKMYDQPTLDKIGDLVTVDHYISSPSAMGTFINSIKNSFNSNVMIGEFGAPIPDLNGDMTEDQQADFIDKVFQQLYQQRDNVLGVNYWDLTDGSTALMNPDQSPRKATEVIKKYFEPPVVFGKVTDRKYHPLANISVTTDDNGLSVKTDNQGNYSLPTTATDMQLKVSYDNDVASASVSAMEPGHTYKRDFLVGQSTKSLTQQLQELLNKLFH